MPQTGKFSQWYCQWWRVSFISSNCGHMHRVRMHPTCLWDQVASIPNCSWAATDACPLLYVHVLCGKWDRWLLWLMYTGSSGNLLWAWQDVQVGPEWWVISHPTWSSEDLGFIAHKNVYEEALHHSEKERHEYNLHIEVVTRTMGCSNQSTTRLPNSCLKSVPCSSSSPTWAGLEKAYTNASSRISMVKRQVWTFFKIQTRKLSLHMCSSCRLRWCRMGKWTSGHLTLTHCLHACDPAHQLAYDVEDVSVLQDVIKITLLLLDQTQGQINSADCKWVEVFLRSFVPLFFVLNHKAFNHAFTVQEVKVVTMWAALLTMLRWQVLWVEALAYRR